MEPLLQGLGILVAYAVPAASLWDVFGLPWWGQILPLTFLLSLGLLYALSYGLAEVLGMPLPVPGSSWQVPVSWVKSQRSWVRSLIWGFWLGPGIFTRNPDAGIWFLPLLLSIVSRQVAGAGLLGALIGLAHGAARAIEVTRNCCALRADRPERRPRPTSICCSSKVVGNAWTAGCSCWEQACW